MSDSSNSFDHNVQFYEGDSFLGEAVADFLAAGLRAGQTNVAILTMEHREQISFLLARRGFDIRACVDKRMLQWFDAHETLTAFMDVPLPNVERFQQTVGKLIEECRTGREHLTLHVFGEMVDLLARDGNLEGAVRLEELWNEIGKIYGFSLLCAYAKGNFYRETQWRHFQQIRDSHRQVTFENGESLRESGGAVRRVS